MLLVKAQVGKSRNNFLWGVSGENSLFADFIKLQDFLSNLVTNANIADMTDKSETPSIMFLSGKSDIKCARSGRIFSSNISKCFCKQSRKI